jgi:uroporphyrinogen decarboxylase
MMNKIERVHAALKGEPVDRVPASFWFHFPSDQIAGHAMAQAHLDYYRQADQDFLKVMNDNRYPVLGAEEIQSPQDWRRVKPAPLSSEPYQAQLDGLREILDEIGDEVLVITTVFNPYATGNYMSGRMVTAHLRADPESVSAGLSTVAESLAAFSQECIDVGAAGIFFSAQGSEKDRFTDEQFEDYIQPHDLVVLQAAEEAGGTFNVLHVCGQKVRLDAYTEYPAQAANWGPQHDNPSLREGQEILDRTVIGGVDERGPIVTGPRAAIEAEVHASVRAMGTTGFMIGAGCTVPDDVPVEHLIWAREALADQ